jgi:ABC-type Zn uptake system ZnuABC Zn-binding protein ZnuA
MEVVATTTQVADLVRSVGGEGVEVEQVIEPGTDPHDYEPRPSDVGAAADAAIVFRSGGEIDEWAEELVSESGSEARLVSLDGSLPVRLHGAEAGDGPDPHWWHDPRNAAAAIGEIEAALIAAEPSRAGALRRRSAAYLRRLHRLDRVLERCVAAIPPAERRLVTDHDALAYYANRYGFEVVGSVIPALTTEAQPSAGELADLADRIEREDVPAIFPEAAVPDDVARALAGDSGASVGGEIHSDSLGEEGSPSGTYLGMLEANTDAIVRGLTGGRRGCAVPGTG